MDVGLHLRVEHPAEIFRQRARRRQTPAPKSKILRGQREAAVLAAVASPNIPRRDAWAPCSMR